MLTDFSVKATNMVNKIGRLVPHRSSFSKESLESKRPIIS